MTDQPEFDFVSELPTVEEAEILRFLAARCRGRDQACPVKDLVSVLYGVSSGHPMYRTLERAVRRIVKHLVETHGQPIASCKDGFFIPETPEEVERCCRQYHRAALSHLVRESRLRRKSLPELLGQMQLEVGKT